MKAISLVVGTTQVSLIDVEEPQISHPEEIKIKVWEVGICGTDREEAAGGRADAPSGQRRLILGHEMFGEVVQTGEAVKSVKNGDLGLFTVRRGCGKCVACNHNRSDMCLTGDYTERGIKERDGYQTEYVVDKEQYFVKVPHEIRHFGVLTEPMSVAAKAIDEALMLQKERLKDFEDTSSWLHGKKALVAGVGAVGLLAALSLRLRGAEVYGLDIVDENSARPEILKQLDATYIDGRKVKTEDIDKQFGGMDFVFEAAGFAELQIELIDTLGKNGIYVSTGIPGGDKLISLDGAQLVRHLVLNNQVMLGSVNASRKHFQIAVNDLKQAHQKWPEAVKRLITRKVPYTNFEAALLPSEDDIKVVVEWNK